MVTLKDDTGFWLTGEPLLQQINDAFKKLFLATSTHTRPPPGSVMHYC